MKNNEGKPLNNYNPNLQNPNMPPNQQYAQPYANPNMPYQQGPPMNNYNPQMMQQGNFQQGRPFIPHKDKIMMQTGLFIKQDVKLLEVVSGCEVENKYYVYQKKPGKTKKKGKKLWKAKEKSGWCSRNCMSNPCRPLDIKIKNLSNLDEDPTALRIHKPCTCTFLCCNRPEIFVEYSESGQDEYIGKIVDLFDCCNFNFNVYDNDNKKVFRINASCCQCGIQCGGWCCTPCETVLFEVFDKNGNKISEIIKKNKDCIKNALTDSDNFGIEFTPEMDWKERSLLLSATLFIDYMMFEEKGNRNQGSTI